MPRRPGSFMGGVVNKKTWRRGKRSFLQTFLWTMAAAGAAAAARFVVWRIAPRVRPSKRTRGVMSRA
jgi:hypothetical protein